MLTQPYVMTNQTVAAPTTSRTSVQRGCTTVRNAMSVVRPVIALAAASPTAYWAMLKIIRQGAWRIRQLETTTAPACTATAGPSPQASRIAKAKQTEGKTAGLCRWPGGVNGRASETRASAAIVQNATGRSGICSGSRSNGAIHSNAARATTVQTKLKKGTARPGGTEFRSTAASIEPPDAAIPGAAERHAVPPSNAPTLRL